MPWVDMRHPDLAAIKARLAAVPPGVIEPDGLCWTRLGEYGGALHTGGDGGIVYRDCAVASVECPPERDPAMELLAHAPADLAAVVGKLEQARRDLEESQGLVRKLTTQLANARAHAKRMEEAAKEAQGQVGHLNQRIADLTGEIPF